MDDSRSSQTVKYAYDPAILATPTFRNLENYRQAANKPHSKLPV